MYSLNNYYNKMGIHILSTPAYGRERFGTLWRPLCSLGLCSSPWLATSGKAHPSWKHRFFTSKWWEDGMKAQFLCTRQSTGLREKPRLAFCTIKAHTQSAGLFSLSCSRTPYESFHSLRLCTLCRQMMHSSLNTGRTWKGTDAHEGAHSVPGSLPHLLFCLFFAAIPGNNCHFIMSWMKQSQRA